MLRLIAGLGNPGADYNQTRHNAGFWFVDELAQRFAGIFRREPKFFGEVCRIDIEGTAIWLLKPGIFMNRSGVSLAAMSGYYKLTTPQMLIVHDEIDLPAGTAKYKRSGGHGGHNGLRDIIAHLGKDFWRLRIGVGHPGHRDHVTDYVLSRPSKAEDQLIHDSIVRAIKLMPLAVAGETEKLMHQLHTKPDNKSKEAEEKDTSN